VGSSIWHRSVTQASSVAGKLAVHGLPAGSRKFSERGVTMDDYWEELLDHRAQDTDPLEPADDATEL
jgi:hypothetical protein